MKYNLFQDFAHKSRAWRRRPAAQSGRTPEFGYGP